MKQKRLIVISSILVIMFLSLLILDYYKIMANKNINSSPVNKEKIYDLEYGDIAYVSDYVKVDRLIDKKIEYSDLGKQIIIYTIIDENNKKINKELNINVIDTSAPVVMLNEKLTIVKESVDKLTDKIMCADIYDKHPYCEIKGEYDLNKVGIYPLTFIAKDSNGNEVNINFELNIIEKTNNYSSSKTPINEVINNYKSNQTKVGIDVSKWQGKINWAEVKKSGVEFAMIRVGFQKGFGKDNALDEYFLNNIENALKEEIPVGIYFYSYATTKEEAVSQAKWVKEQIKGYDIKLPVVFDWESWSKFNMLDLNLYEISEIQETFLNEIKSANYKTARYGSKNYLTYAWQESEHLTWLAHYINNTTYEGEYFMWQICNNGIVSGIDSYVDINVLYE